MADMRTGITPTQVDASAVFPVGLEADDPRNGFTGNRIKYFRANGSIAANNVFIADVSFATAAERHATVVNATAVSQSVEGVNDITGVTVTSGQFFWGTVKGRAIAKTSAITAATNNRLGTSGTAGTLVAITGSTPTGAEVIAAIAAGIGKGAVAMSDTGTPSAGVSYILLS